jgi:hypothetical protein
MLYLEARLRREALAAVRHCLGIFIQSEQSSLLPKLSENESAVPTATVGPIEIPAVLSYRHTL